MNEQNSITQPAASEVKETNTRAPAVGLITREIGIDAGHRVTNHGSKCRNFHGHRYKIEATLMGKLFEEGEQEGMVLDFSFLKDEMMNGIDAMFDHGMILWRNDPIVVSTLNMNELLAVDELIREYGIGFLSKSQFWGKTAIIPLVPTAENLAKIWYHDLSPRVDKRSKGRARLLKMDVWETPNCKATYLPEV